MAPPHTIFVIDVSTLTWLGADSHLLRAPAMLKNEPRQYSQQRLAPPSESAWLPNAPSSAILEIKVHSDSQKLPGMARSTLGTEK